MSAYRRIGAGLLGLLAACAHPAPSGGAGGATDGSSVAGVGAGGATSASSTGGGGGGGGPPVLGINWPDAQVFPSFAPIPALDVIEGANRPADIKTLLVTLEGVVNRTQPRIYVGDGRADDELWLDELGVPTTSVDDPLALVTKYLGEIAGLVIYDDAQPDTINLATTIAGEKSGVVVSPALAATLTAAPYALPTLLDLRTNQFKSNLEVYQYELDGYAAAATHRLIVGLDPGIAGTLRDYAVATKALTVWLDPQVPAEKELLGKFLGLMGPASPYLGWWKDEPSGVQAAAGFGVPVFAADFSNNLTVLGGAPRGSAPVAKAPAPPPLENKVYVAIFMSDGDNLQEDQHLVPLKWADPARGKVPVGWTVSPALVDVAPTILRYFQRTATENDVLVSGPSGLGYTYPAAWPPGLFDGFTKVTGKYMAAAGLQAITVWNHGVDLTDADAHSFAQNIPGLLGLTIQDATQKLRFIDGQVPLVRLDISYSDTPAILESGIDAQLAGWSGAAPRFVTVQGNMNDGATNPAGFQAVRDHYAQNANVVFVRPDHFFQLLGSAEHPPQHRVLSGDFNGDGKTDSVTYAGATGDFAMGLSDGVELTWHGAGNTASAGNLLDGKHAIVTGDFNGDGRADLLAYASSDGSLSMGLSDGNAFTWHKAGDVSGFGDLLDGAHRLFTGDFNGDKKTDLLFYYNGDSHWWMGLSNGAAITWHLAGDSSGEGNLLDGTHAIHTADFDGDHRTDVMLYGNGDGAWKLGLSDGSAFSWKPAGNTSGFGNLLDGDHALRVGDFTGDHLADELFYFSGDGNWWMGVSDGGKLSWHMAGNTAASGNLLSPSHRLFTGDFDGDQRMDVAFYSSGDGAWLKGLSDGNTLAWHVDPSAKALGNLVDPGHLLFLGDHDGDGKTDALFYDHADASWWMGASTGATFSWHMAGSTVAAGDLTH